MFQLSLHFISKRLNVRRDGIYLLEIVFGARIARVVFDVLSHVRDFVYEQSLLEGRASVNERLEDLFDQFESISP